MTQTHKGSLIAIALLAVFVLGGTSLGFEICCCADQHEQGEDCGGCEDEAGDEHHHGVVTRVRHFVAAAADGGGAHLAAASHMTSHQEGPGTQCQPMLSRPMAQAKERRSLCPALFLLHSALLI